MARTALAIQDIPANSGAQLVTAAPDSANGNMFDNDGTVELVVRNGSGAPVTPTIVSVPCSHGRSGDQAPAIAAGAMAVLGPFSPDLFNQRSGVDAGKVYVNWSASASVTVTARRKP